MLEVATESHIFTWPTDSWKLEQCHCASERTGYRS